MTATAWIMMVLLLGAAVATWFVGASATQALRQQGVAQAQAANTKTAELRTRGDQQAAAQRHDYEVTSAATTKLASERDALVMEKNHLVVRLVELRQQVTAERNEVSEQERLTAAIADLDHEIADLRQKLPPANAPTPATK